MTSNKPTPETYAFAREVFRVNALNEAGLSKDEDFTRLERLAAEAEHSMEFD